MSDEPFDLMDEVLGLQSTWELLAEEYERHAPRLLDSFWPYGSSAAGADLRVGADLLIHLAQLHVMRAWLRMLEEVLQDAEEARVQGYSLAVPRVVHSPSAPET